MNPHFVLVDDDPSALKVLGIILESLGCTVTPFSDGPAVLEWLGKDGNHESVDAVFLDLLMPGMLGIDVLRALRAQKQTEALPVILVTACDKTEHIVHGYQLGASYYITKPFNRDQIVYGLDLTLSGEQQNEETDSPRKVVHLPEAVPGEESAPSYTVPSPGKRKGASELLG